MRWAILALLLLPLFASAEPLIFSATGCGPYKPEEEPLLEKYIRDVNADTKSDFLVHLGDIVSGTKKVWPEAQYKKVADILKTSKIPVLIVPGDNEWNDLEKPAAGWQFWEKHFTNFEKNFKNPPELSRQQVRPENFAFVRKGVLLVGINLVGGRVHHAGEWDARMKDDADWIAAGLARWGNDTRALVVFAQAMPSKDQEPFFVRLGGLAKKYNKPVLYLHADGHVWQVEKGWRAPNMLRVQTDQMGRNPPVLVTVTEDATMPFVFDRRVQNKK